METIDSLYYVLTDHLGSWEKVMDEGKNTGHEHYDRFKIVNANARLYDPVIGRFFSPDPFVQVPDFTQSFNRYSYCFNNPVMFVDPTGLVLRRPLPDGPLKQVVINEHSGFMLPEVIITPYEEPVNHWEEFHYTPYSGGSTGYTNDCTLNSSNANVMSYSQGGASGGNIGGRINHSTPDNNVKHNNDIEVPSKLLTMANLYTTIESISFYNTYLRTWRDKSGIVRSMNFHGNQYTGGMNSYGKMMSMKFTKASGWLNGIGIGLSLYEIVSTENEIDRTKYSMDVIIGVIGFAPGGGFISTFWFLGGRNLIFLYGENMNNLIENGINPGLLEYQPFK